MKDFQERVIREQSDLAMKISKLRNFITLDTFKSLPVDEQLRLQMQSNAMILYLHFLTERINHFQG